MKTYQQILAGSMLFAATLSAHATTIDFTSMAAQNVTSIGDVTFSLAGEGEQGDAYISGDQYGGGLWNSTDASYPTNTILKAEFDTTATGIMFDFDNEGSKATFWSLFDSSDSLIATGSLSTGNFDLSTYTGVKSIEWNNNGNNWLFAVETLTYQTTSAVPEPSTYALMLGGLGLVGFMATRRRKQA